MDKIEGGGGSSADSAASQRTTPSPIINTHPHFYIPTRRITGGVFAEFRPVSLRSLPSGQVAGSRSEAAGASFLESFSPCGT